MIFEELTEFQKDLKNLLTGQIAIPVISNQGVISDQVIKKTDLRQDRSILVLTGHVRQIVMGIHVVISTDPPENLIPKTDTIKKEVLTGLVQKDAVVMHVDLNPERIVPQVNVHQAENRPLKKKILKSRK